MTDPTNNTEQSMSFFRQALVCLGICSSVFLAAYLWDSYTSSQATNVRVQTITPITEQVSTTSSGVRIKKIQEVEVGERAVGMNPELTDSERSAFLPDPEPATWRKLTLEMIKPNGKRLDITLLRPLSWIGESQADIGATIYLDLPEMGAQGLAKVLNIEPCPPIKHGKGNVITGTFHHEATNTIDLHVEGLSKPIGCTDNHPFWSVTRNEFVEAGKLLQGEELQLYKGQTAKVVQILPRPGPEQVHNLEVMNEHVYRVTDVGALVHNQCTKNYFTESGKVRRYDGPKPTYMVNPQHVPGPSYVHGKTPLPKDAQSVFSKAVPNDPDNPTAWFGANSEGQVYRFSVNKNGEAHFSGIAGVGDGTRNITPYVYIRLGVDN
jgi:hypothetical protein